MKRRYLWLSCICLLAGPMFTLIQGCGTTAATKVAQGDQIVITGVNDGMAQWALFVNAGKATQAQINTVKLAYTAYYDAQQVLKAILEKIVSKDSTATSADITTANTAVVNAENTLLDALKTALNAIVSHNA